MSETMPPFDDAPPPPPPDEPPPDSDEGMAERTGPRFGTVESAEARRIADLFRSASEPWLATERAVLGSMTDPVTGQECRRDASDIGLLAEHFDDALHRKLFAAIGKGELLPWVLAGAFELPAEREKALSALMLDRCWGRDAFRCAAASIVERAKIRAARTVAHAIAEADDATPEEIREQAKKGIIDPLADTAGGGRVPLPSETTAASELSSIMRELEARLRGDTSAPYGWPVPEAFAPALDALVPGRFYVIGARPKRGKTVAAMQLAWNVASIGGKVLFFSLEMPRRDLVHRLIGMAAGIDPARIMRGDVSPDEHGRILDAGARIHESGMEFITAVEASSLPVVRRIITARERRSPIGLVIVDYLQLVRGTDPRAKEYEQVTEVAKALKPIAAKLACPVVALSQLRRLESENREPRASDFRSSGQIEQAIDHGLFIHWTDGDRDRPVLIHSVSRHGGEGRARLGFDAGRGGVFIPGRWSAPRGDRDVRGASDWTDPKGWDE